MISMLLLLRRRRGRNWYPHLLECWFISIGYLLKRLKLFVIENGIRWTTTGSTGTWWWLEKISRSSILITWLQENFGLQKCFAIMFEALSIIRWLHRWLHRWLLVSWNTHRFGGFKLIAEHLYLSLCTMHSKYSDIEHLRTKWCIKANKWAPHPSSPESV